ncbi:TFIIH complex subunit tfb5 [Binucleata daphniae]
MVKMIRGTLIRTEPSLKEIILSGRNDTVIEDVSDTLIFVKSETVNETKGYVERMLAGATKQFEKNDA